MSIENVENRVINCFQNVVSCPVTADSLFSSFKNFDSLCQLETIMRLEAEFKCDIHEDELPPFESVRQVIDHMSSVVAKP